MFNLITPPPLLHPEYFIVFVGSVPILEILDFHYPKTLDSGKAQFSFISVLSSFSSCCCCCSDTNFLGNVSDGVICQVENCFSSRVKAANDQKKNKNEKKKNKNSKIRKKTFLINCLALHLPWQLGNFGNTPREGSKRGVYWFSSHCV